MKNSTLILGVGNYLQQDDGLSVHTIERLMEDKRIPEDVQHRRWRYLRSGSDAVSGRG